MSEHTLAQADALRLEAMTIIREAEARAHPLKERAKELEKSVGSWPPCHLCGRRDCSH